MKKHEYTKGDAMDVVVILIAVVFLLVVFKIDIIGYVHNFVLWLASKF